MTADRSAPAYTNGIVNTSLTNGGPGRSDQRGGQRLCTLLVSISPLSRSRPTPKTALPMRNMRINVGDDGPEISVRQTDNPDTWQLEWSGDLDEPHARRMLRAAETVVLRNGGGRVIVTCPAEQEALRAKIDPLVASGGGSCGRHPGDKTEMYVKGTMCPPR